MRVLFVLAGLAVGLGGCVSAQDERNQAIRASVERDGAACDTLNSAGKFKTRTEYAKCLNAAEAPLVQTMPRYSDLLNVKMATRLSIADRVDRGEITSAQAQLESAQTVSSLVGELERRSLNQRAVAAQEEAASAAYKPVTCNRFGYSVTCY